MKKQKEEKTVPTLLRMSRLPLREPKTFRNFDFSQVQGKEAEMLQNLSTLAALHGRRNLHLQVGSIHSFHPAVFHSSG